MSARDTFDTLTPEAVISINGKPLPNEAAADVAAVTVVEDIDAAGMCTVTIAAWDTVQMKPKWIDDALFEEGHPLEVEFGYGDSTDKLFSGEITGLEPDFPHGRPPTLTVRAYDRRHRLMRATRTRSFVQCKDSDIAAQLAGAAGLRADAHDSGAVLPYVLQHNQTDLEFLCARARRIGFEVWVRGRELVFRPPAIGNAAILKLHRDVDLLSFRARLSTLAQVTGTEVRGWDPTAKQVITGHGRPGDESRVMAGAQAAEAGPAHAGRAFDANLGVRVLAPVQTQEEADGVARRGYAEMALRFVTADGTGIGQPKLRAGTVVDIEGVGSRFSGPYYVTATEHVFNKRVGYRTRFAARRNAR